MPFLPPGLGFEGTRVPRGGWGAEGVGGGLPRNTLLCVLGEWALRNFVLNRRGRLGLRVFLAFAGELVLGWEEQIPAPGQERADSSVPTLKSFLFPVFLLRMPAVQLGRNKRMGGGGQWPLGWD